MTSSREQNNENNGDSTNHEIVIHEIKGYDSGSSTDTEEGFEANNTKEEQESHNENFFSFFQKRKCTVGSIIMTVMSLAGIVLIIYFYAILEGDVNNIPTFQDIFDRSPFEGVDPEDAARWSNVGTGLRLEVVNCLDRRWYSFFDQAILDWDNGYPDSLTLLTSVRPPDVECRAESSRVKVCNGVYGPTGWKGQAEVFINNSTNTIIGVSARMNEYYLGRDSDEDQYAMCHELGHAWGLHHTDESFTNRDLGNCMDYTNRHHNNLTPDLSNYQFLHALYGLVPGAEPYQPPTQSPTPAPTFAPGEAPPPTTLLEIPSSGGNNNSPIGSPSGPPPRTPPRPPPRSKDNEKDKKEEDGDERKKRQMVFVEDEDWLADKFLAVREQEKYQKEGIYDLGDGILVKIFNLLS